MSAPKQTVVKLKKSPNRASPGGSEDQDQSQWKQSKITTISRSSFKRSPDGPRAGGGTFLANYNSTASGSRNMGGAGVVGCKQSTNSGAAVLANILSTAPRENQSASALGMTSRSGSNKIKNFSLKQASA